MVISAILTSLISPLGAALILGTLALLLSRSPRKKLSVACAAAALLWLGGWSLPVTANWISDEVGKDFPPLTTEALSQLPKTAAIVLLGGGISPATATRPDPDLGSAADRVWLAARLYRSGRAPLIIASGGHDPAASLHSEAAAMRPLLRDLGVPDAAIVLEERSRNTRQNALETAALLRERGIRRVLLVTSASHMARARKHFVEAGIEVVAAATDHERLDLADLRRFVPNASALELSARALKEWVGQRWW